MEEHSFKLVACEDLTKSAYGLFKKGFGSDEGHSHSVVNMHADRSVLRNPSSYLLFE